MTKSVVVTGANSGIGLVTALELAGAGFQVIGTVRSDEKAKELWSAASRAGVEVGTVVLDVADATSTVRGFTEIAEMTDGGPWAVVNNAGYPQPGAIEDVEDDLVRQQLETNLVAPARIARLVLPTMRERRSGRIVNISSISGRVSFPLIGWYCASKQGLAAMSDALRMEVAPFGVRVTLVEPGSHRTGIWERGLALLPRRQHSAYRDQYAAADEILRSVAGMPGPRPVARAVLKALTTQRPQPRYVVGTAVRGQALLDAVAPTAATDWAKQVAIGLRTPPAAVGRALARLRR